MNTYGNVMASIGIAVSIVSVFESDASLEAKSIFYFAYLRIF